MQKAICLQRLPCFVNVALQPASQRLRYATLINGECPGTENRAAAEHWQQAVMLTPVTHEGGTKNMTEKIQNAADSPAQPLGLLRIAQHRVSYPQQRSLRELWVLLLCLANRD